MTQHHLTKSNFKLGCDCPFKLRYYKAKYPSTLQDNEMLEFFAEGGFMVEAIAHAVMLQRNPAATFEETFTHGRYSARVDGWETDGKHATLTEIKAKSVESGDPAQFFGTNGEILGNWREYLLDITFQVMVARAANPGLQITPKLCMVNKTKPSNLEAIYANIDLLDDDADRSKPRAVFTGDAKALAADHFLEFIDCTAVVDLLMNEVVESAAMLLEFMDGKRPDITPALTANPCKKCEFRGAHLAPNGFNECWGETPPSGAHVIDLPHGIRGKELGAAVAAMLDRRDYELANIPDAVIEGGKSYGPPRRHHVQTLRTNKPVQEPELVEKLQSLEYPLHFIDFEASRIPVPYLPGMKPYEQVAFQFSCHTLTSPDATELQHSQWLNLRDVYPNEEFIRELRNAIGERGTVLVWSHAHHLPCTPSSLSFARPLTAFIPRKTRLTSCGESTCFTKSGTTTPKLSTPSKTSSRSWSAQLSRSTRMAPDSRSSTCRCGKSRRFASVRASPKSMLQLQKLSNSSQATSKARISHAIRSSRFAVDGDHGSAARRQPVLPDHHHRCGVEPAVAV
ncbi:MAG: DUF2779 domain-containing protein, partial [Actinobacteria bacterium]|nr:DUF2779 domain-containing protein [Actinomycetota bacterium]